MFTNVQANSRLRNRNIKMNNEIDGILLIAYGGPEKHEDIRPFLENVTKGFNIPSSRIDSVAHHYENIGGSSPINELTYRQSKELGNFLKESGLELPVYVGMRNWHPFIVDSVRDMSQAGIKKALGIIMAAHQCDASWDRYKRDVKGAIAEAGVNLTIDYIPPLFDHPLFIEDCADNIMEQIAKIPPEKHEKTKILFSAHSIPANMADDSPYVDQLKTSANLIAEKVGDLEWELVYQSRSGRPTDPWLEPDICDVIKDLPKQGYEYLIVLPVGFVCDHVEVLYDIGIEAKEASEKVGLKLLRAKTVNADPKFIRAMGECVLKHINKS